MVGDMIDWNLIFTSARMKIISGPNSNPVSVELYLALDHIPIFVSVCPGPKHDFIVCQTRSDIMPNIISDSQAISNTMPEPDLHKRKTISDIRPEPDFRMCQAFSDIMLKPDFRDRQAASNIGPEHDYHECQTISDITSEPDFYDRQAISDTGRENDFCEFHTISAIMPKPDSGERQNISDIVPNLTSVSGYIRH